MTRHRLARIHFGHRGTRGSITSSYDDGNDALRALGDQNGRVIMRIQAFLHPRSTELSSVEKYSEGGRAWTADRRSRE